MRKLSNSELKRVTLDVFRTSEKMPVVIVLDNLRSMHNVGSIFRTADAFHIEKIHLCGITATPPHREIQKTALGATESVEWSYFPEVSESLGLLKAEGFRIVAVEQMDESIQLEKFNPAEGEKLALIFGNEISGISDETITYLDLAVEIPQFGTKHSFNVTVSAGIVLWHLFLRFP
jgi:tRNA G18 (ribose-2'-O)-methylase SpoU